MILDLLTFVLLYVIYSTPIIVIFLVLRRKKKDKILKSLYLFICTSLIVQIVGLLESILPLLSLLNMNNPKYMPIMITVPHVKTLAVLFSLVIFVYQIWVAHKKEDIPNG